jgi:acyl-CoA reductase-like NAD-dependent aldehyde dehydrogenase
MKMLVAGEWSAGSRQEKVRNPYSGAAVDTVPVATVADAERVLSPRSTT